MYAFRNFLSSNSMLRSNTLDETIQTKQIRVRVEIIPSYLNDYMPNQKNNLSFQSLFLEYAKSCVRGTQSPTSENIIQRIDSEFFHRDSLIMATYFIFLGILVTLTVLKQEFRKRE